MKRVWPLVFLMSGCLPDPDSVAPPAPSGCSYSPGNATYTRGQAIAPNTGSCAGGGPVVSWAVSPSLPAGLSLNTSTGVISGTPTAVSPSASYTVTATNSGGSATASLSITVNDVPPSGFSALQKRPTSALEGWIRRGSVRGSAIRVSARTTRSTKPPIAVAIEGR